MPASLALFFGLLGRSLEVGGQPPNADHCAARGPGPGGAATGECATRLPNGLDRHHFQRIERCQRGSGEP